MTNTYRVIEPYAHAYPDPVTVRAGESLVLGEEDREYPGWRWVTDPEDRSGWAPLDLADPDTGLARYDYTAAELDAEAGEMLRCEEERDGWAWCITAEGRKGWIPLSHLEPAP